MKNQEEIIIDVLSGMKGIGGAPSNEEFYTEFEMRVKAALGLPDVSGISIDLEKDLFVLVNKYAKAGLSKGHAIARLNWVAGSVNKS